MTISVPPESAVQYRDNGTGGGVPSADRRRRRLRPARERAYWPFLLPALLLYTALMVGPALFGGWVSLQRWAGPGTTSTWAGLRNFRAILSSGAFQTSLVQTLQLAVVGGLVVFAVAFLSMVVLREMAGRAFIRAVIFLPMIISMIAIGVAVGFLLNPNGVVNTMLGWVGIPPQPWLGPQLVFGCIIAGVCWASSGFYVALLMSAADGIPESLYEDCRLSGATKLQQFWHVTFPLTWDAFSVAAVLWVVNALKTFDVVLAFTSGGNAGTPPLEARTVAVEQYVALLDTNLGSGAAMGIILLVLCAVLVVLVRRLTRRERIEIS